MQVDGEPWVQSPGDVVVLRSALKVCFTTFIYTHFLPLKHLHVIVVVFFEKKRTKNILRNLKIFTKKKDVNVFKSKKCEH